ncbi:MAG: hypothetical protein J6C52_00730, partial [Clostridia bacterium]|nr:hypothetical protein [Clostridia bacterium]
MKRFRLISLFLALLMASAVSCGESAQGGNDTTAAVPSGDTTAASAEIAPDEINRENAKLTLPATDFGGEAFNILYVGEDVYRQDIYAEENGDVVDDAVFARNLAIEELLGCKINLICFSDSTT